MKSKIDMRQFIKNVGLSIIAQVISLVVSFVMNLILPKYISEYQYAYWQTYLMYIGYVGIFHFGLLDGIVLRYSQFDYDEIDKSRIRSQFKFLLLCTAFWSEMVILVAYISCESELRIIFILAAIGIITRNIFTYTSYMFQITNRITKYANMIICYRIFYGIVVCALLAVGVEKFYYFCIADLCSDIFGIFVGAFYNKNMYFGISLKLRDTIIEVKNNISSGIMLMLSNWSSFLLIGSARMLIQRCWDTLVFGKVSFSLSITNLFLTFIAAISVVLFPSLKRIEQDNLSRLYQQLRTILSPLLLIALIFYYPGCWLLNMWLPVYTESLKYLGILLPIIVFSSKISLLTNNYLKALRKEKMMLVINLFSVGIAIVLFSVCAYKFKNLSVMLMCIVFVLMLCSFISELVVMRALNIRSYRQSLSEMLMTIIFIASANYYEPKVGFMVYLIALILYICWYGFDFLYVHRQSKKFNG